MQNALNAFVIRGVASNLMFQSALLRHPRFAEGRLTTAFIPEEFPHGFRAADLSPADPVLLAAAAAAVHRAYRDRAAGIEGQLAGHELEVGEAYVVLGLDEPVQVNAHRAEGGCDVRIDGRTLAIRHRWRFGEILLHGTCNGTPFAVQVERPGLKYRMAHLGALRELTVLPARAAELLAMMPQKLPPDRSREVLSPMPGLLAEVAVQVGQAVKAGERLVVIEAMKMQNVLLAERDGIVAELLAAPGESLAVDQPVLRFQ
jgi:propionyl-CoA carboxylase alpha chain